MGAEGARRHAFAPLGPLRMGVARFSAFHVRPIGPRMERRAEPIYSKLAEDPTLGDAVDAFVVELAERVDALQDFDSRADFESIQAQASELSLDATKTGYDTLALAATAVVASAAERNRVNCHKALQELTEVARCIRLGHRGAV